MESISLTAIPYGDEDDAVAIANDSDYGLAGSVFTADPNRGLAVAGRVRTGTFGAMAMNSAASVRVRFAIEHTDRSPQRAS